MMWRAYGADGTPTPVDPSKTPIEIIDYMAAEGSDMPDTEPSVGSKSVTRRECKLTHSPITGALARIESWMSGHEQAHVADRKERQAQIRWVIGLLLTVVGLVVALGGLQIVAGA